MTSQKEGMMPEQFITKVVGVSFFPDYPNNIYRLAESVANMTAVCSLRREPENEHDNNAICVDVNGETVGRIPRLISAILGPKIDAGEKWNAAIEAIIVSSANVEQPGLKINVWRDENVDV